MKWWKWLTGKKTYIGAAMLLAGEAMKKAPDPNIQAAGQVLVIIGSAMAGVGVIHKAGREAKTYCK